MLDAANEWKEGNRLCLNKKETSHLIEKLQYYCTLFNEIGGSMEDIKKILFPVDLSEVSSKIVPWVLSVAKKYNAEVYLLFAARTFQYYADGFVDASSIMLIEGELIKGGEKKLGQFSRTYFSEYPSCRTKVVLGDVVDEILSYIQNEEIDLVIMGTHGRKGLKHVLLGSVADRIIKMAQVPVLTINPYRVVDT
jgi:nucleotide-binding universal stress UspA family protein